MAVTPVPHHYHQVNIDLTYQDAKKAIEHYQRAFGAKLVGLLPGPGGKGVMHAELRMGDTTIFLGDDIMGTGKTVEAGFAGAFTPHLAVEDADATWRRALEAGCKEVMPLELQIWGDRYGQVVDPFGLRWAVMTHVEDVALDEINRRVEIVFGEGHGAGA